MDSKAIKDLNSDKLKAKNNKDYKDLSKLCNCLGRKYLQSQRYEEAIAEHKQELEISLRLDCRLSEAIARRALGECYSEINEYNKALAEHQKYLSLTESLGDQIEVQRAFATLGRTHLLRAQELYANDTVDKKILIEAKKALMKALDKCQTLTQLKDKELAEMRSRLYLNLGLVAELMGQFKESMTYFNLSIQLNQRYNLIEDLYRSQYSLASVYEKNNETEKALDAYQDALKSAKLLKNKSHSCDALMAKAMVLLKLRKFNESRKLFKKAYKLKSPIAEEREKSERSLIVTSLICNDIRELSETDSLEEKMKFCDRLGDHFVEFKLFDISIEFYKRELHFAVQCNKSDAEIAKIYVSIAQTYADDGKYEKAIEYFEHELNYNRGNGVEESRSLVKIAEMKEYLESQELNEDIINRYEMAIEKIESEDNYPKNVLIDTLQRFIAFVESRRIDYINISEFKNKLNSLTLGAEDMEIEEIIEPDIYDSFDLKDISECSSDSDEEMPSYPRCKRTGKALKRNEKGETPLHVACIEGNLKQVKKLLNDKHPTNVKDYSGWTPLHEAANNGHKEVVELLLECGANINDNEGEKTDAITPLHDACSNGHFDVIRVLLRGGAKVSLLTNSNETALDMLREWKKRSTDELDNNDLQEFRLLEKQLEEALNKEGFVKQNIPLLKPMQPRRVHKPLIRSREQNTDDSDDSLDAPIASKSATNSRNTKDVDIDNPKVARQEYRSTISNLRRNGANNNTKRGQKPKAKSIPALLGGNHVVSDDQWLINDLNERKKRSCLDAYDALNKRSKTSLTDEPIRRRPKPKVSSKRNTFENSDESEVMSDIESIDEVLVNEHDMTRIETVDERVTPITSNNQKTTDPTTDRSYAKPIQLRVCVGDNESTLLVIPILNRNSNCLWLKKEVEKRYFNKFGVKPDLSLETTDGALLSDEDCILDVIIGDELKVIAKIESWLLDPLHERYKDICNSCDVKAIPDIVNELQMTQINGCLKLSDINIAVEQIKPIFRALQRQNYFREINISCSNIIFDDRISFFECLPLLPSLQVLNLKCTAMSLQTMEELATKCCPNLMDLNLSFNSFGDYFIEVIVKVINNFPKLNAIDLSACDLTEKFVSSDQLKECLKNPNLRSIVLDYNPIDCQLIDKFRNL